MTETESETLRALVCLAFESLRSGYPISEGESAVLDRLPAIDALRKATEPRDLAWLLPLLRSAPDSTAGFACSLLRHLVNEPGVAQAMIDRWEVASPYLKNRILWRLLEYEGLTDLWFERFLGFILESREIFEDFNRRFFGPSDDGLARIQGRIRDDSFPTKKKWIYWLCIPSVVLEETRRNELLAEGLLRGDDLSRRAIRAYQEKFGGVE